MLSGRKLFYSFVVCGTFVSFFSLLCFCVFFSFVSVCQCNVQWLRSSSAKAGRNYSKKQTKILFMALTIASLNVRGLRDNIKRREVFNWLRAKKFSIYMLQEVHSTENTNHLRSAEWGYQTIFSTYKSNKAGVCILFNNNFNLQIEKLFIDPSGRFIICDIKRMRNV